MLQFKYSGLPSAVCLQLHIGCILFIDICNVCEAILVWLKAKRISTQTDIV